MIPVAIYVSKNPRKDLEIYFPVKSSVYKRVLTPLFNQNEFKLLLFEELEIASR